MGVSSPMGRSRGYPGPLWCLGGNALVGSGDNALVGFRGSSPEIFFEFLLQNHGN